MKSFKALLSYLSLLLLVGSPGSCWAAFVERRATIKSVAESIEQKALETKTVEETEKVEKPDVPVVEQEEEEEPIVMEEEEPEETKEANADPVPAISHLKRGTHLVITDATVDDLFALAILSHKLCPAAKAAVEAGDELPVTLDVFVSGLQQLFAGYEAVRQTITYFGCPELVATTRIVIADNARTRPKPHEDFLLQVLLTACLSVCL
uniref:Uncharacterized protein n=1 Tax=Chromera velia CCMP2878 TaxID=1169474 RepID=A0A0K6SAQ7_9ALVE|eukprot:Cvel_11344.t1-p1 / transcript=Cvel_11344.t1 / gene=Cvel_11344 / organism=Chromera_velia_CCMP2878 / gene_product=hypothetical protein / transcript_product=hypothetical protein / location=Cvel_scaffold710:57019-59674(+) / protein_length=207 / sequence_SO=supercontig / SO=protein_coding / is_pseudo=false